ncbi:hypothetical protein J41TS2_41210 [Bacillus sonorensis]|nr:hypothetical protein J41TS2_41210 [Bacillus sonorensis]
MGIGIYISQDAFALAVPPLPSDVLTVEIGYLNHVRTSPIKQFWEKLDYTTYVSAYFQENSIL